MNTKDFLQLMRDVDATFSDERSVIEFAERNLSEKIDLFFSDEIQEMYGAYLQDAACKLEDVIFTALKYVLRLSTAASCLNISLMIH